MTNSIRVKRREYLRFSLFFMLACQLFFVFTIMYRKIYTSPFPSDILYEYFSLKPLTEHEDFILKIYEVVAPVLTIGCYMITIYISQCKRTRAISKKLYFGQVMSILFLMKVAISIGLRGPYMSIAVLFLSTEGYSLVLLGYIRVIQKEMVK